MANRKPRRAAGLRRFRGPWRVAVVEASMRPAIEPGDWLLIDPTVIRWPRRGSVVVFREPDGERLAIKRVAAGPGERVRFADGYLELAEDEAWLVSDATPDATAAAGFGEPIDSRRYGPVQLDLLVGRAWFRYAPLRRLGRIARVSPPAGAPLERFGGD
jgi:signal peptidase I